MIEVSELNVVAGTFQIENFILTLREGAFHILLGPTGSGKTLLLEAIAGLRSMQRGKILLGEKEIQNLPPEERGISYVPQDLALFPHLTVRDNLLFGLRVQGRPLNNQEKHIQHLVEALKIGPLLSRYPAGLSGGEKQRVALGRALAPAPQLLLLDEPLAALDPGLRGEIQRLLISLHRDLGFTALHVTHDIDEAYLLGDTITVLIHGKIEQKGIREEVFLHPNSLRVAHFLGLRNLFEGKIIGGQKKEGFLFCSLWEKNFRIPSEHGVRKFSPGEDVILYLRPEEVLILREGKPIKESLKDNILNGEVIRILDRGTYRWVLFTPHGIGDRLEIHLPNYVFRNLELKEGQKIQVAMRRESFWILPKD